MFDHGTDLENLQNNIPVKLISTQKSFFKTCREEEIISDVIRKYKEEDYDNFPVVKEDKSGAKRIIGLINVKMSTSVTFRASTVKMKMERLSEKNLIGADASILSYIELANSAECRLLVSGIAIFGMVCLSDLQKLPVRSAVFALITNLEQIMISHIEHKGVIFEVWKDYLDSKKIKSIEKGIKESKHNLVSKLLFTDFSDKISILEKLREFDESRRDLKNELLRIRELRNKMYHANDYAHTTTECKNFVAVVALCQKWSKILSAEISSDKQLVRSTQ